MNNEELEIKKAIDEISYKIVETSHLHDKFGEQKVHLINERRELILKAFKSTCIKYNTDWELKFPHGVTAINGVMLQYSFEDNENIFLKEIPFIAKEHVSIFINTGININMYMDNIYITFSCDHRVVMSFIKQYNLNISSCKELSNLHENLIKRISLIEDLMHKFNIGK